jgi:hypothetical protein
MELNPAMERYGDIVHVMSTYATGIHGGEPEPSGVNSMQLVFDGQRWWMMSVIWGEIPEVVRGDFDDPSSLRRAMEGMNGMFLISHYRDGIDREVERGIRAAEIAPAAGIALEERIEEFGTRSCGRSPSWR